MEERDPSAAEQLLPLVYDELRKLAASKLAQEKPGQTLQATALVHEAYLRLVGNEPQAWNSRGHFFAAAAEAMRRILINRAQWAALSLVIRTMQLNNGDATYASHLSGRSSGCVPTFRAANSRMVNV